MNCGGSKKLGYMDLGGNFVDMSNSYRSDEPVSGYGSMGYEGDKKPPGAKHASKIRKRQAHGTRVLKRNIGKCGLKKKGFC